MIVVRDLSDRLKEHVRSTTTSSSDTTALPPPAKEVSISHCAFHRRGWGFEGSIRMAYRWVYQYRCEKAIVVLDLSERPNDHIPNDYHKFRYHSTVPAGQVGAYLTVRDQQVGDRVGW